MNDPANWPAKLGFLCKPEQLIGKTIKSVRHVDMEYGCTHRCALVMFLEDGSRAFLLASDANRCLPSPTLESMKKADAYTPEEVGQIETHYEALRQKRKKEREDSKRREFERLKRELGDHS